LIHGSTTMLAKGSIDINLKTFRDQNGPDRGRPCFPTVTNCGPAAAFECPVLFTANAITGCSQATANGWCTGEIEVDPIGRWRLNGGTLEMLPGWFTFSAETAGGGLTTGDEFCDSGHDETGTLFTEGDGLICRATISASTGASVGCGTSLADESYYKVLCGDD